MASLPTGDDLLRLISSLPTSSLPSSSSNLLAQSQLLIWNALLSSIQNASATTGFVPDLEEGEIPKPPAAPKQSAPSSSSSSSQLPPSAPLPRRSPVTDESIVRQPLSHGWARHTFIREMTCFGIKGIVVYFSPCGKRLGSFSEVLRYLAKMNTGPVNREQFTFSPKVIVGEFFVGVPKNGQLVNVKFTEEDVKIELKRLQEERAKKMGEERAEREEKRREMLKKEKEDRERQRKEEIVVRGGGGGGMGVGEKEEMDGGEKDGEGGKRRAVEDLTLEEIRPLPPFKRIQGLELGGAAFGDLLMAVQFIQNFKKALQFDWTPSVEDLSRGCMGDASSSLLPCLHSLLSRSLTHLSSSRRFSLNGKSLASIPVTDSNRDELLRLFLSQTQDGDGNQLSSALSNSSFLGLTPDQKAAVMGALVNELVCSSVVRGQLDGHLEEVTKLKGERWMKEGKMRALRNHQNKRRKRKNGEEEAERERPETPERSIKFTPGIGQCEVLSPEEEALDDGAIDAAVHDLGVKSDDLSSSINALNSRVRFFPIGEDRYHRLYWGLPSDLPTLIEAVESGHVHNPACDLTPITESDPASIQTASFIDPEVIGCLEDTIDRLIDGGEGRKRKLGLRLMGNAEKRGWWTVTSKDVDQWKANLHQRGMRERVLHRSITRNDLIDDLPLGEISIGEILKKLNGEEEEMKRVASLHKKVAEIKSLLVKEKIIKGEIKLSSKPSMESLKAALLLIQEAIPRDRLDLSSLEEKEDEEEIKEEKEKVDRMEEWRAIVSSSTTVSQLELATQLLCSLLSLSSSSWLCSLCLFPSASPSFLSCSVCSSARAHPACLPTAGPKDFSCLNCQPKIALLEEDEDQIIDVNDEDRKCGLPSRGGVKRRAEPNSFIVPPSMVNGLGRTLLDEMQEMEGTEFFASPVDLDEVPSYSVLIDKPMDLGTISEKIDRGGYIDADDLYADVSLVFSNCRAFNEDDSEIGEAGLRISRFFAKRWRQLKYNLSKRVKRMKLEQA